MKTLYGICILALILPSQLLALDARSEMMVRYYEDKPIIQKRSAIVLENASIELDDATVVTLNSEGLNVTNGALILDTFSVTFNPKQAYILLTSQEVLHPSEPLLLVRKDNNIYIVDLEKELQIGQFTLHESQQSSYITLMKDTDGYTSLNLNNAKIMQEMELVIYNGESYIRQDRSKYL